jgi:hypothetical protein
MNNHIEKYHFVRTLNDVLHLSIFNKLTAIKKRQELFILVLLNKP